MAKFVVKDAVITVNGVDLSNHVNSVTVELTTDEVDVTGMTPSSYREFTDGFKDANFTCTFFQNYAGTTVDPTLYPLYSAGSIFPVTVKAQAGGTVVHHLDQARLYTYTPVGGGVGDASSFDATFRNAGTAGYTRGTV